MKRKRQGIAEYEDFLLKIVDWQCDYLLSLGDNFRRKDPYSEYQGMELKCEILAPARSARKPLLMHLIFKREMDAVLNDPVSTEHEPQCVGKLTIRGERRAYLGSLPFTSLNTLIQLLGLNQVKYISLHGEKLRHGSTLISSIHFDKTYEPDDYS